MARLAEGLKGPLPPPGVAVSRQEDAMETRELGRQGLTVSALGLGCMGMSDFYGTRDEAESIATIHRALDLGVTLLDTADMYGPYTNEELVGKAVRDRREPVVLAYPRCQASCSSGERRKGERLYVRFRAVKGNHCAGCSKANQ